MKTIANTSRLSFRLLSGQDAELLFELDQDPEVMRFINGGKPTSREDIKNIFVPRLNEYTKPDLGWGMWGFSSIDNNEFIGWILLRPKQYFSPERDDSNLEIGWRIKRKFWRQGLTTEAANAVMDMVKQGLPEVTHIHAIAMEKNLASIQVMKKLGLLYQHTYLHVDPLWQDEVVYYELPIR